MKTIMHNGVPCVKAKVHMLPTEDESTLYKLNSENSLHIGNFDYCENDGKRTNQHLYFTTDEDIKEGDWCVCLDFNRVFHASGEVKREAFLNSKKIIATTDKLMMPWIHQSFIEEYCKAGGIDEVLVEYEDANYGALFTYKDGSTETIIAQKLKVDPIHNTIIIHPVKEMYTADSINTLRKLANAIIGPASEILPDTYDKELKAYWDWIEENL